MKRNHQTKRAIDLDLLFDIYSAMNALSLSLLLGALALQAAATPTQQVFDLPQQIDPLKRESRDHDQG